MKRSTNTPAKTNVLVSAMSTEKTPVARKPFGGELCSHVTGCLLRVVHEGPRSSEFVVVYASKPGRGIGKAGGHTRPTLQAPQTKSKPCDNVLFAVFTEVLELFLAKQPIQEGLPFTKEYLRGAAQLELPRTVYGKQLPVD
jgi:hypothetical protein